MTYNSLPELTDREIELMYDPEIFPLKLQVNDKLYALFNAIGNTLKDKLIALHFFKNDDVQFRISKGENYLQNPYIILDLPQITKTENLKCLRCMFWYGHYFSLSLLLIGKYAHALRPQLLKSNYSINNWKFSFASEPWLYNMEDELMSDVTSISVHQIETHLQKYNYIKLMRKIEPGSMHQITTDFLQSANEIAEFVSGSTNTL